MQRLGGEVRIGEKQEYGRMEIEVEKNLGIFGSKKVGDKQMVWMSHGDEAARLPEGFEVVARSQQGAVAAVENRERRFFGLQYHPEVSGFDLDMLHFHIMGKLIGIRVYVFFIFDDMLVINLLLA